MRTPVIEDVPTNAYNLGDKSRDEETSLGLSHREDSAVERSKWICLSPDQEVDSRSSSRERKDASV